MAEIKVSAMTAFTSIPDDAVIYVVKADGSYGKITKANFLAGIGGSQNLESVTNTGRTTTHGVTLVDDSDNVLFDLYNEEGDSVAILKDAAGNNYLQLLKNRMVFQNPTKQIVLRPNFEKASGDYYIATTDDLSALALKADKSSFMMLNADYTLTNSTALQKLFNVGANSNGALNVGANETWEFYLNATITGLSSTSGTISFGSLGSATLSSIFFQDLAAKATSLGGVKTAQLTSTTITTGIILVTASTGTTANLLIHGTFRTSGAGSFIPAIITSIGVNTAVVEQDSIVIFNKLGNGSVTASSDID